jgi:hypothetical protein
MTGPAPTAAIRSLPIRGERVGPLHLVVGVTGHRDLRAGDGPALEASVGRVLVDLMAAHPATPLLIVSPLAEGADRLVAAVGLELGARLLVPLPLPRPLYEADFQTPASREEFARLLARADEWFELPLEADADASDVARPGPARDRHYARVGAWIACRSHVLLALWDGRAASDTPHDGGTASIVRLRLDGQLPGEGRPAGLDPPDRGPVYQVVTPRARDGAPDGIPFSIVHRFPGDGWGAEASAAAHRRLLARMDAFNQDALALTGRPAGALEGSREALLPAAGQLSAHLRAIREVFAVADVLALHHQRATYRALRDIFRVVLVASVFFAVFEHLWPAVWPLYVASLALAGLARLRWRRARRENVQGRYQDYRALAEGLRVLFYWRLAGLVDPVAAHYLRKQRGELDWIRLALEVWSLPPGVRTVPAAGESAGGDPEPMTGTTKGSAAGAAVSSRLEAIARHWIGGQAAYFREAARRDEVRARRFQAWAGWALAVWLVLSALLLGVVGLDLVTERASWSAGVAHAVIQSWPDHREWVRGALLVGLALSLVVAALLHNFAEKRALPEHARQYTRMALLFAEAERQADALRAAQRWNDLLALIRELGREALIENGDWLLLHRERPLEIPKG